MFLTRVEYDYLLDTARDLLADCFDASHSRLWTVAGVELVQLDHKLINRVRDALGHTSDP